MVQIVIHLGGVVVVAHSEEAKTDGDQQSDDWDDL
jgi:hypothetical protein